KLQSAFAGAVGDRFDSPVVPEPGAVEHHLGHAGALRFGGEELAHRFSLPDLAGPARIDPLAVIAHAHQHRTSTVVDQLGVDVLEGTEHDQPGTLRRSRNLLPYPQVPAIPPSFPGLGRMDRSHVYFAPVLPALRRTRSPRYRTPLPL